MAVDSKINRSSDYIETQTPVDFIDGTNNVKGIWSRSSFSGLHKRKFLLILGDGVSEGMSCLYEKFMGEEWAVHRSTGSLSVCSPLYIDSLVFALTVAKKRYNSICFTPSVFGNETPQEFEKALRQALSKIKELHPLSKIVLVGITMVNPLTAKKEKNIKNFGFNKTIQLVANEFGCVFADLGTLSQKIVSDHTIDGIFFTDAGYQKLSFEVVKYIK